MFYTKKNLLTISFQCRIPYNIQIIDFVNAKMNIVKKLKYAYIDCSCNLEYLKDYNSKKILLLNYIIKEEKYIKDVDVKLNMEKKDIEINVINGIFMNEKINIDKNINVKLYVEKKNMKKDINAKLNYEIQNYIKYINGRIFMSYSKYDNNIIEGKLNYNKKIYENDIIVGKLNIDKEIYDDDIIEGRLVYIGKLLDKDINVKLYVEEKNMKNDIDVRIGDIEKKNIMMEIIEGRLVYDEERKMKKDIDVRIGDIEKRERNKDINVNLIYDEDESKNNIDVRLNVRKKNFRNYIGGRLVYKEGYMKYDIGGRLNYISNGYVRTYFDGILHLNDKEYKKDEISVKLNLEEDRWSKDVIDVKLNLMERCNEYILPLKFVVKNKCYFYSIFGKLNLMDEEKRDICVRVNMEDERDKRDIDVKLNLNMYEFWNNINMENKKYIIPYEGDVDNNEFKVRIRNVINNNVMENYERDIDVKINDVIVDREYEKDIDVKLKLVDVVDISDIKKDDDRVVICKYYDDRRNGICLMNGKMCNNSVLCGKRNIIKRMCKDEFEIECGKYELCGKKCIMEWEKRMRNEKRKEKIYEKCLLGDIVERKRGAYNILSDRFECDMNDMNNDIYIEKNKCEEKEISIIEKKECKKFVFGILIYVDELWVVEPYVFKSCLISVLDRYYDKCDDIYINYGGNIRTDFDVVNLCLNYKIPIEKIKKINGDIDSYIKTGFGGYVRKAYIFMNDPYNWKNTMKIRRIVNVCRDMNIDVIAIGNGGEYLVLDGIDWNYVEPDIVINDNDTNKIVY